MIRLAPFRAATALWLVLGVSSGLGCIPIFTPRVQQDITTGDKLLALKMAEACKPPEELAALRADLLAHPPDMRASIDDGYMPAQKAASISSYSALNPGFYASLATERADLKRARCGTPERRGVRRTRRRARPPGRTQRRAPLVRDSLGCDLGFDPEGLLLERRLHRAHSRESPRVGDGLVA